VLENSSLFCSKKFAKKSRNAERLPKGLVCRCLLCNHSSAMEISDDQLNCVASHPDANLSCSTSDMQLWVHSGASCLSESKARSRRGGHFFLSSQLEDPSEAPGLNDLLPPNNGAILVQMHIMKEVVPLAAKCEFGSLSNNGVEAELIRTQLDELGWTQHPVPFRRTTAWPAALPMAWSSNGAPKPWTCSAAGFAIECIKATSASVGQRCRATCLADCFVKNHPVGHHRVMRPAHLHVEDHHPSSLHARVC